MHILIPALFLLGACRPETGDTGAADEADLYEYRVGCDEGVWTVPTTAYFEWALQCIEPNEGDTGTTGCDPTANLGRTYNPDFPDVVVLGLSCDDVHYDSLDVGIWSDAEPVFGLPAGW